MKPNCFPRSILGLFVIAIIAEEECKVVHVSSKVYEVFESYAYYCI